MRQQQDLTRRRVKGVGWSLGTAKGGNRAVGGELLELRLGYSHPYYRRRPEGVEARRSVKGEATLVRLSGRTEVIGERAGRRVGLRPYNAYTGHGVWRREGLSSPAPARRVGKRRS